MQAPHYANVLVGLALGLAITPPAECKGQLIDPSTRDESIDQTTINSRVQSITPNLYEYTFDIHSPNTNKGRLLWLEFDLECLIDFGETKFPKALHRIQEPDENWNLSRSPHLPVRYRQPVTSTGKPLSGAGSISVYGVLIIPLGINPGGSLVGLKLLSPGPPDMVKYKLTPSFFPGDADENGNVLDYSNLDISDGIPKQQDFEVHGHVLGPSCSK